MENKNQGNTPKKKAPQSGKTKGAQGIKPRYSTSTVHQRTRLLAALREAEGKGLTTIQIREGLDIIAPAPRVHELRHGQGHNIQTIFQKDTDSLGHVHSVARYVLLSGKFSPPSRVV